MLGGQRIAVYIDTFNKRRVRTILTAVDGQRLAEAYRIIDIGHALRIFRIGEIAQATDDSLLMRHVHPHVASRLARVY